MGGSGKYPGEGGAAPSQPRPSALDCFDAIAALFSAREPAVFLDFDGTLTPIVSRAEEAHLSPQTRTLVQKLAGLCPVAVVSGRDLEDVRRRVGLPQLYYAGSHGFDIAGPPPRPVIHRPAERFEPLIEEAAGRLRRQLHGRQGVHIEQKRYALAVHYREAPPGQAPAIAEIVQRVCAQVGGLRLGRGKKVFDLQPDVNWHKGKAVRWLLEEVTAEPDPHRYLPIYIGDDVTDEDAFRELDGIGIGIVVSGENRPSCARYGLRDSTQVRTFLQRLVDRLNEIGR